MNFQLTEEHELIRASVREFCEKHLDPIADEIDREARFPAEIVKKMAEQDWLGIPYPPEYGGAGSDYLSYIIVIEELSRACASTGFTLECHTSLACYPLFKFGTEEAKAEIPDAALQRRDARIFCTNRTGGGHRCRFGRHRRRAGRKRMGAQRQ